MFAAIGRFFSALLAKLAALAEWFLAVVVQAFVDLWEFVTDAGLWFVDQGLELAVGLVAKLPGDEFPDFSGAWGSIGGEALNILGLIGLHYCLGLLATALLIRFGLQLIPFVRLGS